MITPLPPNTGTSALPEPETMTGAHSVFPKPCVMSVSAIPVIAIVGTTTAPPPLNSGLIETPDPAMTEDGNDTAPFPVNVGVPEAPEPDKTIICKLIDPLPENAGGVDVPDPFDATAANTIDP